MALEFGSNTIQFRKVMARETSNGNVSFNETFQVRTKDTIISILGIISLGSWSDWVTLPRTDLIYVDENGNPL